MRPLYLNGRFFTQPISGVERYGREVFRRFPANLTVLLPQDRVRGVFGHLWEQCYLPRKIGNDGLLYSPANTGPILVKNQVVTIHDVSVLDHPEWFRSGFARWYRFLIPRLVQRASAVITDSEFSKNRIIYQCQIPAEKIFPIPCGVDLEKFSSSPLEAHMEMIRRVYGVGQDYILSVGTIEPRKNIQMLVEAWKSIRESYAPAVLVIAGGEKDHFRTGRLPQEEAGVLYLGRVPDALLPGLYTGARAFVYPSIYEGFGLPILEAMASGAPVIASNCTAIPEVVGNAGLLVAPGEVGSLAEGMARLLSDRPLQIQLAELGRDRAALFSWEATAERIWEVLVAHTDGDG